MPTLIVSDEQRLAAFMVRLEKKVRDAFILAGAQNDIEEPANTILRMIDQLNTMHRQELQSVEHEVERLRERDAKLSSGVEEAWRKLRDLDEDDD